jgi:hypothetical protein
MKTSLFLLHFFAVVAFGKLSCNIVNNGPEEIKIKCVDDTHNIDFIRGSRVSKSSEKTEDLVRLEQFWIFRESNFVGYITDKKNWFTPEVVTTTVIKPGQQSLRIDQQEYIFSISSIAKEGNISVIYGRVFLHVKLVQFGQMLQH